MNIIDAIIALAQGAVPELKGYPFGNNRANSAGQGLEEYIKDLFAGTVSGSSEGARLEAIDKIFSYTGNQNNPPDAMLRGGDAIEVKKLETRNSDLALNSSYPKHVLLAGSKKTTKACRESEEWTVKDIIYAVGFVSNNHLKELCFVYGLDYAADRETYTEPYLELQTRTKEIPDLEFAETLELGRINRVDPLGITYLRIRGMWGIQNPWKVFEYVYTPNPQKRFNFMCIINGAKWATLENADDLITEARNNNNLCVKDVRIKNPNNPASLVDAKLITYSE